MMSKQIEPSKVYTVTDQGGLNTKGELEPGWYKIKSVGLNSGLPGGKDEIKPGIIFKTPWQGKETTLASGDEVWPVTLGEIGIENNIEWAIVPIPENKYERLWKELYLLVEANINDPGMGSIQNTMIVLEHREDTNESKNSQKSQKSLSETGG